MILLLLSITDGVYMADGVCLVDDDGIQTFFLQKSTLIDWVESGCMRCECGCKWKSNRTMYEYTAGTFEFKCTNPKCKSVTSFTTQRRGVQGDYALNSYLVASIQMNCGNLTRLNCVLTSLRAATIPESFHKKICKQLNPTLESQADEELKRSMQELKEQAQRDVEVDGRFNRSRNGKFITFPAINQANNKLVSCDTLNVKDETPSGNPWKAENFAAGELMRKLEALQIELDNLIHDACRQLAKRLDEHKAAFKKLNEENKLTIYKGTSVDNNDTWHSGKSYETLWQKCIDIGTKSVKRGCSKRKIVRDSKDIIAWRATAEKQLRSVTKRVKQAFLQATGSVHTTYGNTINQTEKEQKVMDALSSMLIGCLLHDDHRSCKNMCGPTCPCSLNKELETYFRGVRGDAHWDWDDLPTALAGTTCTT